MPAVKVKSIQWCSESLRGKYFTIGGYKQFAVHSVVSSCNCKQFKNSERFPRRCPHVIEAEKQLCDYKIPAEALTRNNDSCSQCGGELEIVNMIDN